MNGALWKKGIAVGTVSGIGSAWIAMAFSKFASVFIFENGLLPNLISFAVGGALFGIVTSGFMIVLGSHLPFKNLPAKGALLSTSLWLILRLGGQLHSINNPDRFHADAGQTVMGFLFAVILGMAIGFMWKADVKRDA
ncbi:MAG: hypothetical protein IEMM0002_0687 [bacterium]|nr:MAG: hypothetical protein IEMM0002_0687 [bacterium]